MNNYGFNTRYVAYFNPRAYARGLKLYHLERLRKIQFVLHGWRGKVKLMSM